MKRGRVLLVAAVLVAGGCAKEATEATDSMEGSSDGPRVGDHWHTAFGVYVCGEFEPDLPENEAPTGIHTHGDGVIHIHPFDAEVTGPEATLETFLEDTELSLDDLGGEGPADCDGVVQIALWEELDESPTVFDDPAEVRFTRSEQAVTVAFVPDGDDIPLPPSTDYLDELGGADVPDSPTTTRPSGPRPTVDAAGDIEDGFYPVVQAAPLDESCVPGLGVVPGRDDAECYVVDLSSALSRGIVESARLEAPQGEEQVSLVLTEDGIDQFNELAADCYAFDPQICPTGRIAIVVAGEVVSAPTITEPSFDRDQISISGPNLDGVAQALAP